LEIVDSIFADLAQSGFIREEEVIDSIGNRIIEKAWNPEEAF
jgi:hypothetical protein